MNARAGTGHRRSARAALALVVLGVAFALGACADEDGNLERVTLMLNWTPNNHHAGVYAALERGWYREAGIDLRIVEPATAGVEPVVAAGNADFGISQAESLLPARAAGIEVRSIATILPYNDSSLIALAGEGITRPRDLQGKTYGGFGGPLERELIDTLVACDGGDPARVEFVEVGNVDYLAGLEQDRFDFVWVFEGWDALRAREVEDVPISSLAFVDYLGCIPDWYTPVFIAGSATLSERPDLARRFLEVTARGYELARDQPQEAAALLLEVVPELDEELVRASATYHAPRYVEAGSPWGVQERETWVRFEAFLRRAGLLEREVNVDEAFTNDFLPTR